MQMLIYTLEKNILVKNMFLIEEQNLLKIIQQNTNLSMIYMSKNSLELNPIKFLISSRKLKCILQLMLLVMINIRMMTTNGQSKFTNSSESEDLKFQLSLVTNLIIKNQECLMKLMSLLEKSIELNSQFSKNVMLMARILIQFSNSFVKTLIYKVI